MVDKTSIIIASVIALVILSLVGSMFFYNLRDQASMLARKDKCAQVGGVYIDTAQMEGCVRFVSVGQ